MGTNKPTDKHPKRLVEQERLAARSLKISMETESYFVVLDEKTERETYKHTSKHPKRLVERERLAARSLKIGPVTVRRPRLYGQTPPIQNLGTYLQRKACGRALTRAHMFMHCTHMHEYVCTCKNIAYFA